MREESVRVFWRDKGRKKLAWREGDEPDPRRAAYFACWMSADEQTIIFANVMQADIPRRKVRHLLKKIAASK